MSIAREVFQIDTTTPIAPEVVAERARQIARLATGMSMHFAKEHDSVGALFLQVVVDAATITTLVATRSLFSDDRFMNGANWAVGVSVRLSQSLSMSDSSTPLDVVDDIRKIYESEGLQVQWSGLGHLRNLPSLCWNDVESWVSEGFTAMPAVQLLQMRLSQMTRYAGDQKLLAQGSASCLADAIAAGDSSCVSAETRWRLLGGMQGSGVPLRVAIREICGDAPSTLLVENH